MPVRRGRNPFYKGAGVWRRRYEAQNERGTRSKYNSPQERVVPYGDYQVPAIVPPELSKLCAVLRVERMKLAPRNARRLYLLRGILRCAVCGRAFTGVSHERRWFYCQCNSRLAAPPCGNRRVSAPVVERLVWAEIVRFAQTPGKLLSKIQRARLAAAQMAANTVERIARQLAAKERERASVIKWAREERITEAELDTQLAQLRAGVTGLETERARLAEAQRNAATRHARLSDAEVFFTALAGRLDALTDAERAQVLRQLVPRALVSTRPDGRIAVAATYAVAAPATVATVPLRASA